MEGCEFVNNTASEAGAMALAQFLQRDFEVYSYWQVTLSTTTFYGKRLGQERAGLWCLDDSTRVWMDGQMHGQIDGWIDRWVYVA